MATFNPYIKEYVAVIFHKGALLLNNHAGLLEKGPKGKAYAKFSSVKEIQARKEALQKVVNDWVELMDSQ